MKDHEKDYWKSMLNENASFTKGDYRDALSELLLRLDSNLQDSANVNMSHYIVALENQCTAEQIREASQGAAAPLLNALDQYNRAERWKHISEVLEEQQAMPDQHVDNLIALAKALEKD